MTALPSFIGVTRGEKLPVAAGDVVSRNAPRIDACEFVKWQPDMEKPNGISRVRVEMILWLIDRLYDALTNFSGAASNCSLWSGEQK
jgi:hypothetical protein